MPGTRHDANDPISDRAHVLTEEIAALEAQIRELGSRLESSKDAQAALSERTSPFEQEPVFEPVDASRVSPPSEVPKRTRPSLSRPRPTPERSGIWHRCKKALRPAESANPRLINYLAAGSIQGLRPLRYEKRVARNRVVALSLLLLFVLWGLIAVLNR